MKLAVLLLFSFIKLVFSDQILVYSPPANGTFHANDVMDIRYKVHAMGMIKIWSATTHLVHLDTNTTIRDFPNLKWSQNKKKSVNDTVHATWTVPSTLPSGDYYMNITANGTSMCSKNHNGSGELKGKSKVIIEFQQSFKFCKIQVTASFSPLHIFFNLL
ncbi:hypothetical protein BD560DRAFT_451655 [Blakeslea trispora]|nr:hypothetical protein BD560DRAFT_451655 [Blakeslea trispora]